MSILGTRVLRTEDPRFLTGDDRFIDNIGLDGALHVVFVRSTSAHARLRSVDATDAAAAPGVVAVVTGADVDLAPAAPASWGNQAMVRPWLARDVVRYVGEPIAAVVATTREAAVDAAELVVVDDDPLPALVDVDDALAGDLLLHPDAATNVAFATPSRDDPDRFAECEVVVRQRIVNQRVAPCPLEVRAAIASWSDGRLTQWSCTQNPHATRDGLAEALGVDTTAVHVITPDVGGGFGAKEGTYPEEVMVAWLARHVDRPVRWVETRSESMLGLGHGRGQVQEVVLGGTRDGRILAYELRVLQDAGAYPMGGAVLPVMTRRMASGTYAIDKVDVRIDSVVTTTLPIVAYRGAGRPEATAAIERTVDRFATEIGMDPAEVRRRNLVPDDAFPFTTPTRATYDSGRYGEALERALAAAGYDALRAEQRLRRERGDTTLLGIGISSYVEITNPVREPEYGSLEVLPDGRAIARTGTSAHGQGHATSFAMLVSDRTGIPMDRIEVRHGDTDDIPRGHGTGGSRSLQIGGSAIVGAADLLIERARELAADLLEAAPDDVVLDPDAGVFHVAGTPAITRTWAEVASAALDDADDPDAAFLAEFDFDPTGVTFPFGAHVAVVEVDVETGRVVLVRHIACDDAGTIINPVIVEGQVHGGVAQGAAQALFEEFVYDADGNPLTTTLLDYAFPSAAELPSIERIAMETPTPLNPLGAKGVGESGTIGSTPAVQNAVVDALAHLGVLHIDMPCTSERVWQAIRAHT
ncbi:MAG TPA: xanthine dehydrogenase family protein molybdopterin-binding subunit [Acidimicrobiia bacterium]|nr:xanthine dehydrogenase family protein molybdopterin-binding subunit [Acidimicrobiia bacterium]